MAGVGRKINEHVAGGRAWAPAIAIHARQRGSRCALEVQHHARASLRVTSHCARTASPTRTADVGPAVRAQRRPWGLTVLHEHLMIRMPSKGEQKPRIRR